MKINLSKFVKLPCCGSGENSSGSDSGNSAGIAAPLIGIWTAYQNVLIIYKIPSDFSLPTDVWPSSATNIVNNAEILFYGTCTNPSVGFVDSERNITIPNLALTIMTENETVMQINPNPSKEGISLVEALNLEEGTVIALYGYFAGSHDDGTGFVGILNDDELHGYVMSL